MSEPQTGVQREPREVVNVRLSKTGLEAIDALAVTNQRTRSDMIRLLLNEAVAARAKRASR